VLIAEIVGGFECSGLQSLSKRIPVLESNAQEVARAANGPRCWFEQKEPVCIGSRVGQWRALQSELIGLSYFFPHRPDDVHHLPMGNPLAARTFAFLAFRAGDSPLHSVCDTSL